MSNDEDSQKIPKLLQSAIGIFGREGLMKPVHLLPPVPRQKEPPSSALDLIALQAIVTSLIAMLAQVHTKESPQAFINALAEDASNAVRAAPENEHQRQKVIDKIREILAAIKFDGTSKDMN